MYANVRGLHKNLSDLSLIHRGGDVIFSSETLVCSRGYISDLMVLGFDRPMQLLTGEVDRFRGLAVYVRDGFWHIDSVVISVDVVTSQVSGFVVAVIIFMCSACTRIKIYRIKLLPLI